MAATASTITRANDHSAAACLRTVSRTLARLERARLVRLATARHIHVLDAAGLQVIRD